MIIRLVWEANRLQGFSGLLQEGVCLKARLGSSIRATLCDQFGVSPSYLDGRISTVFLDRKPVDDVDATVITEGSVLALSAAMPGFVGAAFRKGGFYAAMRREITYARSDTAEGSAEGFFVLKLYNLVGPELGSLFLEHGVRIKASRLTNFLETRPPEFWDGCIGIGLDGRPVPRETLMTQLRLNGRDDLVQLTMRKG